MKTRMIAVFCAILLLAGMLAACGSTDNQDTVVAAPAAPEKAPASEQQQAAQGTSAFTVHAKVSGSWGIPGIWAWSDIQGDAFEAWPGEKMIADGVGGYYYEVPGWVNYVIINGNDGLVQTADLAVEAAEVWIVVGEDGSAQIHYAEPSAYQDAPAAGAQGDNYMVCVRNNTGWYNTGIWAWSDTEGDLFEAWPGAQLEPWSGEWYALGIPVVYDNVVINGDDGTIQTTDIHTGGRDVWITINYDNYEMVYSNPDNMTADSYYGMFNSRKLSDSSAVSYGLNSFSGVKPDTDGLIKQEYGFDADGVQELALTLYYNMAGRSDAEVSAACQAVLDNYRYMEEAMDFCTISSDLVDEHLQFVIYFRDLDDPANVRQMIEYMGIDSSTLDRNGRIPVPTAEEAEDDGCAVKISGPILIQ